MDNNKKWDKPKPLNEEFELPDFPIDAFSDGIKEYVWEVSASLQVPVDLPAVAALTVISVAVNGKICVEVKPDWSEPINLFSLIVANPAERKSAVFAKMTKVLFDFENKLQKESRLEEQKTEIKTEIFEREKRKILSSTGTFESQIEKIITLEEVFFSGDKKRKRIISDDCTQEKLISLMEENGGKMAVVSAEGGIFDLMRGRYSGGLNIDVYLKAHAGDPIRVDRKGRDSEIIDNPSLCFLLAIQPAVLDGLMADANFRGRGLTARFLYSFPKSNVGHRVIDPPAIQQENQEKYNLIILRLLEIEEIEGKVLKLDPEGYALAISYGEKLEPKLAGELEKMADWAGKLLGTIMRIAGLLHLAEKRESELINSSTMCNAIRIGDYFCAHAKKAYSLMGSDQTKTNAKYLLKKIKEKKIERISKRDLYRDFGRGRFKLVKEMEEPLNLLIKNGYLIPEKSPQKGGVGRKTSEIFIVNPWIYDS